MDEFTPMDDLKYGLLGILAVIFPFALVAYFLFILL